MRTETKIIIAMGTILTILGFLMFPFGYDAIFYFVMDAANGNYGLAVAWMYTVSFGLMAIGIILTRYAHKRKHFTNKYYVFAMVVLIMALMLMGIQVWRMIIEGTPPSP